MKIVRYLLSACLVVGGTAVSATVSAAPNPLLNVQPGYPDIFFRSGTGEGCSYDGTTLIITSTPLTLTMTAGGIPDFVTGGTLTINATIDSSGAFTGGTLHITGVAGAYANPLLTGTITDYGIADLTATTDRVEFVFTVTDGSLAADFGTHGGVIVGIETSTYAGTFGSTWECGVAKGNVGPVPGGPPGGGDGTGTIGFWKNHPDAWPVDSVMIGGQTYSKAEAINILKMAVKGDKTISMAKQLIAAKLNVAAGNDSSCIDATIAAADQWLIDHGGVGAGQRQWDNGDLLHDELDAYNNGLLCAPHRD